MSYSKVDFITAYVAMYGSTKENALKRYRQAIKNNDISYISEVCNYFYSNARKSFYND